MVHHSSPDKKRLWEQMIRMSRSVIIGVTAIIQGIAFGALLLAFERDIAKLGHLPEVGLNYLASLPSPVVKLLAYLASFAVIILVWHEFASHVIVFAWLPTMFDWILQFAFFGVAQFAMIAALGVDNFVSGAWSFWAISVCAVALSASIGYFYLYTRYRRLQENVLLVNYLGRLAYLPGLYALVVTPLVLVVFLLNWFGLITLLPIVGVMMVLFEALFYWVVADARMSAIRRYAELGSE